MFELSGRGPERCHNVGHPLQSLCCETNCHLYHDEPAEEKLGRQYLLDTVR